MSVSLIITQAVRERLSQQNITLMLDLVKDELTVFRRAHGDKIFPECLGCLPLVCNSVDYTEFNRLIRRN